MPGMIKRFFLAAAVCCAVMTVCAEEFTNTQVTIYNRNLGLIYQEKICALERGDNTVQIAGVSRQVQAATVKLSFPKIAGKYRILEQNYLYDLVSATKIFSKYIGEEIDLRLESGETISGTLMKQDGSQIILTLPDEAVRILNSENIIDYEFPALPGGLILKPTLEWKVISELRGKTDARLSYLTGGMSWNAEYILEMDDNEADFRLNSWISLNNHSGTTFENATVKLIAGDIHRAPLRPDEKLSRYQASGIVKMDREAVETREIADYHLYELPGKVTLRDQEMKQVSLFDEIAGSGRKVYLFENSAQSDIEKPLTVVFRVVNSTENNMGFALPEGIVRIFLQDRDASPQLIGEDRIGHTSKKDTLELIVGAAFDVKGKRTVLERDRSITNTETATVRITITNRRNRAVDIEVVEYLSGFWNIRKSSHDYREESSRKLVFPLTVNADDTDTITYTYTRKW